MEREAKQNGAIRPNMLASILGMSNPGERLQHIQKVRQELQTLLHNKQTVMNEEELQRICADEIALRMLENSQQNGNGKAQQSAKRNSC